jgi:hypothetical protein
MGMTQLTLAPKVCPGCRVLKPINQLKKIESRSCGRITYTWRCFHCIKRKELAQKAAKGTASSLQQ